MRISNSGREGILLASTRLQEREGITVPGRGVLKHNATVVTSGQVHRSLDLVRQASSWSRTPREIDDEASRAQMNGVAVSVQRGKFTHAVWYKLGEN